jgi:Domain of unknown function (DUF4115)
VRSFKGELFCSSEHGELYRKEQYEKAAARFRSVSSPSPSSTPLKVSAPETEFEQVGFAAPVGGDRLAAEPEATKLCAYCGTDISLAKSVNGFCSSEHGELYLKEQIEKAYERFGDESEHPTSSMIALASQLQPAVGQTEVNGAAKSADSQPVEALSYTAASPTTLKVSAPEAEGVKQMGSALSSLLLADSRPLDQFKQVDLGPPPSSETKPQPLPAEADRISGEPEVVARAMRGLSDSFSQNTPTAASDEVKPVSAQMLERGPENPIRPTSGNPLQGNSMSGKPMPDNLKPDNKELKPPEHSTTGETLKMKVGATAAGVIIGASILAVIIGISLNFTKLTSPPSQKAPVSKAPQGQTQPSQQAPVSKTPQTQTRPSQQAAVSKTPRVQTQPPQQAAVSKTPQVQTQPPQQAAVSKAPQGQTQPPQQAAVSKTPQVQTQPPQQAAVSSAPPMQTSSVPTAPMAPQPALSGKSRLAIKANQGSWIDVCTDGQTVLRKYFPPLSKVNLGFSKDAIVRMGNSGAVEISINGTLAGPLGSLGKPRVVQFDGKGPHFLMPGDPGTECGR